jgi:hypothetical protein
VSVLKIDKDCFVDRDWVEDYVHVVVIPVCSFFGVAVKSVKICNSKRKGQHFYIEIEPVDANLANRLQWLLGDDCSRVDFNRARIESGLTEWNKLFEVAGRRLRTIYCNTRC